MKFDKQGFKVNHSSELRLEIKINFLPLLHPMTTRRREPVTGRPPRQSDCLGLCHRRLHLLFLAEELFHDGLRLLTLLQNGRIILLYVLRFSLLFGRLGLVLILFLIVEWHVEDVGNAAF